MCKCGKESACSSALIIFLEGTGEVQSCSAEGFRWTRRGDHRALHAGGGQEIFYDCVFGWSITARHSQTILEVEQIVAIFEPITIQRIDILFCWFSFYPVPKLFLTVRSKFLMACIVARRALPVHMLPALAQIPFLFSLKINRML